MTVLFDVVSGVLLLSGAVFVVLGTVGLLRLPDAMTQLHSVGITDTLGVALILLGLVVKTGFTLLSVKLLVILAVLVFTNPAAGHALARAVDHYRKRPWVDEPGERP